MYLIGVSFVVIGMCNLGMCDYLDDAVNLKSPCSRIISRSKWSGREPTTVQSRDELPYYVMLDHTNTPECWTFFSCAAKIRMMQSFQMDALGWSNIGYSFMIGGDGKIYEGRGWHTQVFIGNRWYEASLIVGFIGNFASKSPTWRMIKAARNLVDCGIERGYLPGWVKVIGPQQVLPVRHPTDPIISMIKNWPESMNGTV